MKSKVDKDEIIKTIYLTNFEISGKMVTKTEMLVTRPYMLENGHMLHLSDLMGVLSRALNPQ